MTRPPLVYASRRAVLEAATVLPGAVLENEVGAAIARGNVKFAQGHGTVEGPGWRAAVTRTVPRTRARRHPRPWLVLNIEAAPTTEREEKTMSSSHGIWEPEEPEETRERPASGGWSEPDDQPADEPVDLWLQAVIERDRISRDTEEE